MESESIVKIEKLQSVSEWPRWKFQIRVILNAEELFEIVSGDNPKPVLEKLEGETDATAKVRYDAAFKEWKKKDNVAQKHIATTVGREPMLHIMNYNTAKEMWDKLHAVYEQKSETSIHLLQKKFYSYAMEDDDSVATHISKLEDLAQQLKDLGVEIPMSMVQTKILMTLPSTYSHFHSAWESTAAAERTLKNLTSRLMVEEARILASETEANSSAYFARMHSKQRSYQQKSKNVKQGKCYQCNKIGHWKRDCPTLKAVGSRPNPDDDEVDALVCEAFVSEEEFHSSEHDSDKWFMDSGASDHMSNKRGWFRNFKELEVPIRVRIGNGKHILATGIGDISILAFNNKIWVEKRLMDVLFVPEIKLQLFSFGTTLDKGLTFTANRRECYFMKNDVIVAVGEKSHKLFEMKFKVLEHNKISQANVVNTGGRNEILKIWHERLGHQNVSRVKEILTEMNIKFSTGDFFCKSCVLGKHHRLPFKRTGTSASTTGNLIHTDTCGPMQERSIGGSRYFVLFKDDYSHYRTIFFIKEKSEVKRVLDRYLKSVKMNTNFEVKVMRSDNGTEFVNVDVTKILEENGIRHQRTVPYSPEQNGSAEREMRTIVEAARTMIHAKNLPIKLWAEATNTAVYILNRTGSSSIAGVSPFELWFGKKPEINNLKVFGSRVFTHIPKEKRKKWDVKAEEGIFVGYCDNTKGFRIWQPKTNKITVSRDVVFNERDELEADTLVPKHSTENSSTLIRFVQPKVNFDLNSLEATSIENSSVLSDTSTIVNMSSDSEWNPETTISTTSGTDNTTFDGDETEVIVSEFNDGTNGRLRDRDQMPRPNYNPSYSFIDSLLSVAECYVMEQYEPQSYAEAIKSPDSEVWSRAIKEEMDSLIENNTWSLVDLPTNRRAIDNRWVFKIKYKSNGDIDRYKARLVVKGFTQKYGIDYQETFCPVVKFSSIRMILATAANEKLILKQFDIKTAFLYGELDEEIYMKQPVGFNDNSGKVCRLHRSLYGLKQASRCWNKKFTDFLHSFGLSASKADPCVFIARKDQKVMILAIWTDDGMIAVSNEADAIRLDFALQQKFHVKFHTLDYFLGMEIGKKSDGSIHVHQGGYARKILEKFRMDECHPVSVPMDPNSFANTSDEDIMPARNVPYRELVGSLMYLAIATRPDISFSLSYASQYLENPSVAHWNALKRILKYVKGTASHGIKFSMNSNVRLSVYSDADFAADIGSRRSRSGTHVMMGSAPISWYSQKQQTVSLSTTEAEYIAGSESIRELIWLQLLFSEISPLNKNVPLLLVDNQSAIKLMKNSENHKRSKHIDVKYHFIREKFNNGFFNLQFVPSADQIADILTKPLPKEKFLRLRLMMGVWNLK